MKHEITLVLGLLIGFTSSIDKTLAEAPPSVPAKQPVVAAKAPAAPFDPATAIQKANAFLNSTANLTGDFVQIGGDGKRAEGRIYIQRPGKLRFEYVQPSTLEIIADGTSVAVHDRKLATQDLYLIGQTPLKFLLKDQVDLMRDVKILDVTSDSSAVTILVEDKATLGGTSRIKLFFDPVKFNLKQWQVSDPQGYETLVSLFNLDLSKKPDPAMFKINQERMLNTNN